jgi:hypothetical protein
MIFNTPSACGGVIPLKLGPGLALGFNTLYFYYHANLRQDERIEGIQLESHG